MIPFPRSESLRARIRATLEEDLGVRGDVTSDAIFDAARAGAARIIAKMHGVVAGLPVVALVFNEVDPEIEVELLASDGERVEPGREVARIVGPVRGLLAGERTALNFLQRLSGVATLTARFVEAAGGRIAVCDTRKTTPLWRDLEKYAVRCGGGTNHRMGLYDMAMVKDTHADGAGGLANALESVARARAEHGVPVAAEARDLAEVQAALSARVDLVMLDNMDEATLREAIALIAGRIPTEITGGVTLETVGALAAMGVDRVSVGALTHSAPALDFSMRMDTLA